MTHRLVLIRHAKSSWDDKNLPDKDRPLNARGKRAAQALGEWLASRSYTPDQVLCSSAQRTLETWEEIAKSMPASGEVDVLDGLYQAGAEAILAALQGAKGKTVLMLAHNPGIGELASKLPKTPPLGPVFDHYPTGATLVLEFDIESWADAHAGLGQVLDFITPDDL